MDRIHENAPGQTRIDEGILTVTQQDIYEGMVTQSSDTTRLPHSQDEDDDIKQQLIAPRDSHICNETLESVKNACLLGDIRMEHVRMDL